MIKPLGISSVKVLVEDDQSDIYILHLHEECHIASLPINIFIPQVYVQQRQQEGILMQHVPSWHKQSQYDGQAQKSK